MLPILLLSTIEPFCYQQSNLLKCLSSLRPEDDRVRTRRWGRPKIGSASAQYEVGAVASPDLMQPSPVRLPQLDLLEHIAQCAEEDYEGGSKLPPEVLYSLPGQLISYEYLHALACVSRGMFHAVRDDKNWQDKTIYLTRSDIEDSADRLRRVACGLLSSAKQVCVRVRNIAMLHPLPENIRIDWKPSFFRPRGLSNFLFGAQSEEPLLGCAEFQIFLSSCMSGLYVGAQDPHSQNRTYCRIDNLFKESITWSIGTERALPTPSACRQEPVPNAVNTFGMQWTANTFALQLNGAVVLRANLATVEFDSAPVVAKFFLWAFGRVNDAENVMWLNAIPAPVLISASVECAICGRERRISCSDWRVCPLCVTWVCSSHIRRNPERLCPHCVQQLQDFVGGSSSNESQGCVQIARDASSLPSEVLKTLLTFFLTTLTFTLWPLAAKISATQSQVSYIGMLATSTSLSQSLRETFVLCGTLQISLKALPPCRWTFHSWLVF